MLKTDGNSERVQLAQLQGGACASKLLELVRW